MLVEAARRGDGYGWHEHNHDVHEGCERFFRTMLTHLPVNCFNAQRGGACRCHLEGERHAIKIPAKP